MTDENKMPDSLWVYRSRQFYATVYKQKGVMPQAEYIRADIAENKMADLCAANERLLKEMNEKDNRIDALERQVNDLRERADKYLEQARKEEANRKEGE